MMTHKETQLPTKNLRTKEAYVVVPFLGGEAKVLSGLAPNIQYGTPAFDDGGEDWNTALFVPIAPKTMIGLVSKIKNEEHNDSNQGNSGAEVLIVDTKIKKIYK